MNEIFNNALDRWLWQWRVSWRRTEARFWWSVARKVQPYIPRGVHLHGGIHLESAEAITEVGITGVTAHTHGDRPALEFTLKGDDRQ